MEFPRLTFEKDLVLKLKSNSTGSILIDDGDLVMYIQMYFAFIAFFVSVYSFWKLIFTKGFVKPLDERY